MNLRNLKVKIYNLEKIKLKNNSLKSKTIMQIFKLCCLNVNYA